MVGEDVRKWSSVFGRKFLGGFVPERFVRIETKFRRRRSLIRMRIGVGVGVEMRLRGILMRRRRRRVLRVVRIRGLIGRVLRMIIRVGIAVMSLGRRKVLLICWRNSRGRRSRGSLVREATTEVIE